MPNERNHQVEVYKTLCQFGYTVKTHDAVSCPHCHRLVHPGIEGMADYHCDVMSDDNRPYPVKVEVKADFRRFEIGNLRKEQIDFLDKWSESIGSTHYAYIWLFLGDDRAGSKSVFSRRAWLVPYRYFVEMCANAEKLSGVKYIPMNTEEAQNGRSKDKSVTAESMFYPYRLEWMGDGKWRPNKDHIWYRNTKIKYEDLVNG